MKNKFFKQRSFYAVFLSVVLSVVLVAGVAGAVTTISTNINTGGTLTVSGQSFLNGNVNIGDASVTDNDLVYLYGTTTVIGAQSFVFGSSTDTTIAGQVAGSVYYDSTNRILRLFDGTSWYPVASSTDAAGSLVVADGANRIQFNDYSLAFMTLGTTTQEINTAANGNGALLTLQATSSTNTPLRILSGSTTPGTANLFSILNGGDMTELFVIDESGNASTTKSFQIGDNSSDALSGYLFVSGMATTSGSTGNFSTEGTLTVNGNTTLGNAVTDLLTISGMASTSADIALSIGSATTDNSYLYVGGMATTTGATGAIATQGTLTVGADSSGTAIDRIFAGICTFDETGLTLTVTASSTRFVHCAGATGVTAGDRVMVTATSSLDGNIVIQAASSTVDAISVQLFNLGMSTGTANIWGETSAVDVPLSLQFWVFR